MYCNVTTVGMGWGGDRDKILNTHELFFFKYFISLNYLYEFVRRKIFYFLIKQYLFTSRQE